MKKRRQSPDLKTSPESLHAETDEMVSPNPLPEPDQESPETLPPPPLSGSEMSDDSARRASIIKIALWKWKEQQASPKESSRSDSNCNKLHSAKSNRLHSRHGLVAGPRSCFAICSGAAGLRPTTRPC